MKPNFVTRLAIFASLLFLARFAFGQGGPIGTIDLLGAKYDVYRVQPLGPSAGMQFNALNNRQDFDAGVFGIVSVATGAGFFGAGGTGDAATFSPEGGRFLVVPTAQQRVGEHSAAEDISDNGVVIGWRQETDLGLPPRAFLYSKEEGYRYLDDISPQVRALAERRWPPETGPVQGTKGLRINTLGEMIISGAPTAEDSLTTSFYHVSPTGIVTPLFLGDGQAVDLNNLGQLPPPAANGLNAVIADNGRYAGYRYLNAEQTTFNATRDGVDLPGGIDVRPTSINNRGWVAGHPGIIWTGNGARTDLRMVLQAQLGGSPYAGEWGLPAGMSATYINDAGDITWANLYFRKACPDLSYTLLFEGSGGFQIVDGRFTASVGDRFRIHSTVWNFGRGTAHGVHLVTSPETNLFRLVGYEGAAVPDTLVPGQTVETTSIWEVVREGDYFGAFGVRAEGACGVLSDFDDEYPFRFGKPALGIEALALPLEAELNKTIELVVTLRNDTDEPVANVQLFNPVVVSGAGSVEFQSGPAPASVESLAPGASADFTLVYLATGSGDVTFSARGWGQQNGTTVTSVNGFAPEVRIQSPLVIRLRMKPLISGKPIVNVQRDEDGTIRDTDGNLIALKVEATIENIGDQPVHATLQGIDPQARDKTPLAARIRVDDDTVVPGRQYTNQHLPFMIPDPIEPHGTLSLEYPLIITNNGRFEFSALVSGYIEGREDKPFYAGTVGAPLAVGEKYPVEIELELADAIGAVQQQGVGGLRVRPGGQVVVIGTVRNRLSNARLTFTGIDAGWERNAFGGILTSTEGSAVFPPFIADQELQAGASVVLTGTILTDVTSTNLPTGTVTWKLPENLKSVDDGTGEEMNIDPDDVLFTSSFGGWRGDPFSVRIIQDYSQPVAPALTFWEEWEYFEDGVMIGVGEWTYGTFDSIGAIGRGLGTVSGNPAALADAVGKGSRAIWEMAELTAHTWKDMTLSQKEAFVQKVGVEFFRRATYQRFLDLKNLPSTLPEAIEQARVTTFFLFDGMERAYATGDARQVAELWGRVSGNVVMEVATAFVPTPEFTKYSSLSELTRLSKNADNIRNPAGDQELLLRTLNGPIDEDMAIRGWGFGGNQLAESRRILDRLGMKGYARERSPRSLELNEVLDEAVLKPGKMKPKGINDLDLLVLGPNAPKLPGKPPRNTPVDLDGITAVYWPEPDFRIQARLEAAGHPPEVVKAALLRAADRRSKYADQLNEFRMWKKDDGGKIPVEFNYVDNHAKPIDPAFPPGSKRDFDFETIDLPNGGVMHVPKMANAQGELRYITGDIDWIHFTWKNGEPLDSFAAALLYEAMQRCCGLQHGETIAWLNKGQTIFKDKANQLRDYITGEKALIEVSGSGYRAARIKPEHSVLGRTGREHIIFFDQGSKSLQQALSQTSLETAFATIVSTLPPRRYLLPYLWIERASSSDTSIDGRDWTYGDTLGAQIVRQTEEGSLEQFDGRAWSPWNFQAISCRIVLAPTTQLTTDVKAGTNEIPIVDLEQLADEELAGHLAAWFEPGDVVVIDPGEPTQEVRTVVALGSLILDRPLQYNHPEGTLVFVVPPGMVIDQGIDPALRITDVAVTPVGNGTNRVTITFSGGAGNVILLDFSSDLRAWTPVTVPVNEPGRITIDLPAAAEDRFFRLKR